jgi:hypothetical protein
LRESAGFQELSSVGFPWSSNRPDDALLGSVGSARKMTNGSDFEGLAGEENQQRQRLRDGLRVTAQFLIIFGEQD